MMVVYEAGPPLEPLYVYNSDKARVLYVHQRDTQFITGLPTSDKPEGESSAAPKVKP